MTIQTRFYNWQHSALDPTVDPYESLSPNLVELRQYTLSRWGGQQVGSENNRRLNGSWSTHAYGAALDWRYEPTFLSGTNPVVVPRSIVISVVIPFLINNSAELGIDAIHDYVGDSIWRAGRTNDINDAHTAWWKVQDGAGPAMGESWARWLHIETHKDSFLWAEPIKTRLRKQVKDDDVITYSEMMGVTSAPPVADVTGGRADRWLNAALLKVLLFNATGSDEYDQAAANRLNDLLKRRD